MLSVPDFQASPEQTHTAANRLRYEDVAQDGRIRIEATLVSLGETVWRGSLAAHPIRSRLRREGIVPILRRLVVVGTDAPLSVHRPVDATGRWSLAAVPERERFVLDMHAEVRAPRGDTFSRPVERAGEIDEVAQVYGEHVLTRLFAPKPRRRVTALPDDIPVDRETSWVADEDVVAVDTVGEAVERRVRFGLTHTDSNQHVNSLVYPRFFEELGVEAWGDGDQLMRGLHIAWRKPCFADEEVRFVAHRWEVEGERGVVGRVVVDGESRPRCVARLRLG